MTHPFTPTYISMAKAAEEIQATWFKRPPELSDYIWHLELKKVETTQSRHGGSAAWLPRLDQLLGMLGFPGDFMRAVSGWKAPGGEYQIFTDWHELALAVVMREKYGKAWRDGKWEKG